VSGASGSPQQGGDRARIDPVIAALTNWQCLGAEAKAITADHLLGAGRQREGGRQLSARVVLPEAGAQSMANSRRMCTRRRDEAATETDRLDHRHPEALSNTDQRDRGSPRVRVRSPGAHTLTQQSLAGRILVS